MANRNYRQCPPMREQVPKNPRLGYKIPLSILEHLPEQEMTTSPVAPNENDKNFSGLFYRAYVDSLSDCATVAQFIRRTIGYVLQEPDVCGDFKHFLFIVYGSNWEKRVLTYQTMIVEQLYALITGYGNLTSRTKRDWLNQFDSWNRTQLRSQLKGLAPFFPP